MKALLAKADLYARATGYRVARLITLSEGGGYAPQPPMPLAAMAMRSDMAKESSPISGGELNIRIDVNASFELVK